MLHNSFNLDKGQESSIYQLITRQEQNHSIGLTIQIVRFYINHYTWREIPHAYSPDNNGINDQFTLVIPCPAKYYEFKAFNKWGQRIFESMEITEKVDINLLSVGIYFFILNYETTGSETFSLSGDIHFIR